MTSRISHTSFDAINAYAQSLFWSQVLDFVEAGSRSPIPRATSSASCPGTRPAPAPLPDGGTT
jgi:hypothetical protein